MAGRKLPRIGIIAGSGPDAGIDLWSKILRATRREGADAYSGDTDAPEVTIRSIPKLGLSMNLALHRNEVRSVLLNTVREVSEVSDYFCIACHTLHCFAPEILALRCSARFVSIVDVTCDYVKHHQYRDVALISSSATAKAHLYASLGRHCNVETTASYGRVDQLILDFKKNPTNVTPLARTMVDIVHSLQAKTVILACTELPMMLPIPLKGKTLVDPTTLLATQLARLGLGNGRRRGRKRS